MDIQEETSGVTGKHHWNMVSKLKPATMSEEGKDIWQTASEGRAGAKLRLGSQKTLCETLGSHEANGRDFH
jgi:hypothetical protein